MVIGLLVLVQDAVAVEETEAQTSAMISGFICYGADGENI